MGEYRLQVFTPAATVGRSLLEGFRNLWELGNRVGALAYLFRCRDGLVVSPELADMANGFISSPFPSLPFDGIRREIVDSTGRWKDQDAPELLGHWFMTLHELAWRHSAAIHQRTILCTPTGGYVTELREALLALEFPQAQIIYATGDQSHAKWAMEEGFSALWFPPATWWEGHGFECITDHFPLPVGCGITIPRDQLLQLGDVGVGHVQERYPLFVTAGTTDGTKYFFREHFAQLRQWQVHAVICPDPVVALMP